MGGPPRALPTTIWSHVLAAGDSRHPEHRGALEQLLHAYWKPVYVYIRVAWHKSVEDAKDLTQEFFTLLLERDYMSRVRPEKGSFRGYLKRALKHFLINKQERGADLFVKGKGIPLEADPGELERLGAIATDESPERAYDRAWHNCLMNAAVQQMEGTLRADGKPLYYAAFRRYCLDPESEPTSAPSYQEVAAELGIHESDVRNYLSHCRQLLRQILRTRIRDYVASESDVEEELSEVIRG